MKKMKEIYYWNVDVNNPIMDDKMILISKIKLISHSITNII